jgi:predicted TIM-barrel fold metal-dependent hydrolase
MGPMQPRIFGPYEPIRRDYPMAEYLEDIAGTGVEARSMCRPTGRGAGRGRGRLGRIRGAGNRLAAGHRGLRRHDGPRTCARRWTGSPAIPRVRGVRQQFHWHENPTYRFAADPDLCRNPTVQRNVARLADYGWSFDLQVFAPQMAGAAELAAACPRVTFILQHAGMLEDRSDAGRDAWRAAMRDLAAQPNVVAKLSGFGTFIHRNDAAHIGWLIGPRPSGSSAPTAASSAPTSRSRSSGPTTPRWSRVPAGRGRAGRGRAAGDLSRHRAGSTGSERGDPWGWRSGCSTMATSSWNRAFLVLGRDCGRAPAGCRSTAS